MLARLTFLLDRLIGRSESGVGAARPGISRALIRSSMPSRRCGIRASSGRSYSAWHRRIASNTARDAQHGNWRE
jgi:hypothetical protein